MAVSLTVGYGTVSKSHSQMYKPVTWDDAESEQSVTDVEPLACMVFHNHHQVQHQSVQLTAMPY